MKTMTYITAQHPDARHYEVRDGQGNLIWNCTRADTITGYVTIMVVQDNHLLLDADGNAVTVTFKPFRGVQIIDIREEGKP